jgi:Raf kinase inhibitor-like YbhB/YbcL family protein
MGNSSDSRAHFMEDRAQRRLQARISYVVLKALTALLFYLLPIVVMGADTPAFSLSSSEFAPGRSIPMLHVFNATGCTGGNRSPALEWRNVPAGTQSFAITMFDLDEHGSPSGWWHWVVYDLPSTTRSLPENAGSDKKPALPHGTIQGRTDFGNDAYDGPCPDKGDGPHRYVITIYALKVAKLPVPREASGAMVSYTVREYLLAKSTLTSTYAR